MTYRPRTEQFVVKTAGIVFKVKFSLWTHNFPSDLSVVFETYKENPKNLDGKLSEALEGSEMVNEYQNINLNYDTHKLFSQGR